MRIKKPVKILLYVLGALIGVPAILFMTFVYSPFEGGMGEIRRAVPRTIDFYVGKKGLRDDFEEFPRPKFWEALEGTDILGQLEHTRFYRSSLATPDNLQALEQPEELKEQLADLPLISVDLAADLFGKDFLVAGRFSRGAQDPDWCAYARVSWKVSSAISLLEIGWIRGMVNGVRISQDGDLLKIEGRMPRPLYLCRVKDLALIGNEKGLVDESRRLALGDSQGGEESLLSSADYQDLLVSPLREFGELRGEDPNAAELFLNLETQRRLHPAFENWPGSGDETILEGRLFKAFINFKAMRRLWSTLVFGEPFEEGDFAGRTVTGLFRATMNQNELSRDQERFLGERKGKREWLRSVIANVPQKSAVFGVFRVAPTTLLRQLYQSLDQDSRALVEDGFRSYGVQGGADAWVKSMGSAFQPWFALVLHDQFPVPKVHHPALRGPNPVWAWVFQISKGQENRVRREVEKLVKKHASFGFSKVYTLPVTGADPQREFILELSNPQIPDTGHLAILNGAEHLGNLFIISNHGDLVKLMANTRLNKRPSLWADPLLRQEFSVLPETLSGFLWVRAQGARDILNRYRSFALSEKGKGRPNPGWARKVRSGVRQRVFAEKFAGRAKAIHKLSPKDRKRLQDLVDQEIGKLWEQEKFRRGRDAGAIFDDFSAWLQSFERASLLLQTSTKDIALQVRAWLGF